MDSHIIYIYLQNDIHDQVVKSSVLLDAVLKPKRLNCLH